MGPTRRSVTARGLLSQRAAALFVVAILAVGPAALPFANASDSSRIGEFAHPRSYAPSVTDGTYVYTFAGWGYGDSGRTDEIARFDPATGVVDAMTSAFPAETADLHVAWDPAGTAYLFGGNAVDAVNDRIFRYVPSTDTLTEMGATLATPWSTEAVWDGVDTVYVFTNDDDIYSYTPGTDTVALVLEDAGWHQSDSVAWVGDAAYVFSQDEIWRFHPDGPTVDQVATMPADLWGAMAVVSGSDVLLLGGHNGGVESATVSRFSPGTLDFVMDGRLPKPLTEAGAVAFDGDVILSGGISHPSTAYYIEQAIIRYDAAAPDPEPADPTMTGILVGVYLPDGSDTYHGFAYDPSQDIFRDLGDSGRTGFQGIPVLDSVGRRYIALGYSDTDGSTTSVMDTTTGLWTHDVIDSPAAEWGGRTSWAYSARDGRAYGISDDDFHLVAFDPGDGTVLESFADPGYAGDWDPNGFTAIDEVGRRLFVGAWHGAMDDPERIVTLSLDTGDVLADVPRSGAYAGISLYDPVTGLVYMQGYNAVAGFSTFDPTTGAIQRLGGSNYADSVSGWLDVDGRRLFALHVGAGEMRFAGHDLVWAEPLVSFSLPETALAVVRDPLLTLPDTVPRIPQDDAGTGGDASDDPARPTYVEFGKGGGTFNGTLVLVEDPLDAYGIPLPVGATELCVTITPEGPVDIVLEFLGSPSVNDNGLGGAETVCATNPAAGGLRTLVVRPAGPQEMANARTPELGGSLSVFRYGGGVTCEPHCP